MLEKIRKTISDFSLTENKKHITVAVSGGADSMALLYAMIRLKDELKIEKLSVAHFDHCIRGEESDRDREFVASVCKKNNLPFFCKSADVPEYAQKEHLSMELAARQLRYEFFENIDTDAIATAHTASDNIETVLFNMTRGTALSGICGIPVKRGIYIRPLLYCTRSEIEKYCGENNINYVTDSTNLSDEYTRNKLRHRVIPVLKEINGSVEMAFLRMKDSLGEDEDFIDRFAKQEYALRFLSEGISVKDFDKLHPAVAKRVISRYCCRFCGNVDNFHINQVYSICLTGGKTSIPNKKIALVRHNILNITDLPEKDKKVKFDVSLNAADGDLIPNFEKIHNLLLKNIIDRDKIIGKLVLRGRMPGDKVHIKNKNCTKTLKKLFCEYSIPLEERESLPVLCDEDGIVWIHKIGVAERCAVDKNSKKIYKIDVKKQIVEEDSYEQ